jgi:hypothetical protein
MSYCRWSSDDFACDVYVYADIQGGYTIHVAGRRHVRKPNPPSPPFSLLKENIGEWQKQNTASGKDLDTIPLKKINGPFDGKSFNEPTPREAADKLREIQKAGYNVPQYVIDRLYGEAAIWIEKLAEEIDTNE